MGEVAGMVISTNFPLTLALSLRERGLSDIISESSHQENIGKAFAIEDRS